MKRAAALLGLLFCAAPAAAEPVVFEAKNAESSLPGAAAWKPLSANAALPAGANVRTGSGGAVTLVWGPSLDRVVALDADSRLRVSDASGRLRLEEGRLFLLVDRDSDGFTIDAPHFRGRLETGGCQLDAASGKTLARVFGGRLELVRPLEAEVEEGFSYATSAERPRRLSYADYEDWQPFVRKWYGKKDDVLSDRAEKELVR